MSLPFPPRPLSLSVKFTSHFEGIDESRLISYFRFSWSCDKGGWKKVRERGIKGEEEIKNKRAWRVIQRAEQSVSTAGTESKQERREIIQVSFISCSGTLVPRLRRPGRRGWRSLLAILSFISFLSYIKGLNQKTPLKNPKSAKTTKKYVRSLGNTFDAASDCKEPHAVQWSKWAKFSSPLLPTLQWCLYTRRDATLSLSLGLRLVGSCLDKDIDSSPRLRRRLRRVEY